MIVSLVPWSLRCVGGAVLVAFLGLASPGLAQPVRVDVRGVVTDSLDAGLPGATVVVLQAADSVLVSFGVTGSDGAFRLRGVPTGQYLLQVTFVGLAPHTQPLTIENEAVDVGRIVLKDTVSELTPLVITADRIPIVIDADTLKYNADAFGAPPNATVEALLRRLPGIEVERDGSIKAQGETVEQVLVDGKEFFGADPTIATQNLPADAVAQVQVYDKQSEMAEFTGIDDGEETKTINLALKEDRRQGSFGNVTGGYGRDVSNNRYEGKASINRFSSTTQRSFLGNLNNVNQQGFSNRDYLSFMGGMQAMMSGGGFMRGSLSGGNGVSDGFSRITAGGVNFNHDFSSKTTLRSSYFFNGINNEQDRTVRQQQLAGATLSSRSLQEALQENRTQNQRLSLNLKHVLSEGHDLRFRTNLRATHSTLENRSHRDARDADALLKNSNTTTYTSDGAESGGDASLTYRKRLSERGTSVVAELRSTLNDGDLNGDLDAMNTFYDEAGNVLTAEEIRQRQAQRSNTLTNRAQLSLTHPLGQRGFAQFLLERQQISEDQDKAFYDRTGDAATRNDALSSAFERTYTYNQAGTTLRMNRKRQSFSLGVSVQESRLGGDILDEDVRLDKRFAHLLPTAAFSYELGGNANLDLRYSTATREPSMRELQPFADNSDPVNIYTGNPDLRPEYQHTAQLHFIFFDQFSFTNLFAFARATYTTNKIVRARTIDEQLRQSSTSINAGSAWTVAGNVSFGTPLRALGAKINISNEAMFNRGIELINDEENATKILRNTLNVRLENRNKEVVNALIGTRLTVNVNQYSLNPDLSQNYLNRTLYAEFSYTLDDAWRFTTALDYRLYAQEVFGAGQNIPLWRAELSRSLFNDNAELKLVALDLLDKNVGITYSNASNYIEETHVTTLGRYLMLKFVYNLSGLGGRGGDIEIMEH